MDEDEVGPVARDEEYRSGSVSEVMANDLVVELLTFWQVQEGCSDQALFGLPLSLLLRSR